MSLSQILNPKDVGGGNGNSPPPNNNKNPTKGHYIDKNDTGDKSSSESEGEVSSSLNKPAGKTKKPLGKTQTKFYKHSIEKQNEIRAKNAASKRLKSSNLSPEGKKAVSDKNSAWYSNLSPEA